MAGSSSMMRIFGGTRGKARGCALWGGWSMHALFKKLVERAIGGCVGGIPQRRSYGFRFGETGSINGEHYVHHRHGKHD